MTDARSSPAQSPIPASDANNALSPKQAESRYKPLDFESKYSSHWKIENLDARHFFTFPLDDVTVSQKPRNYRTAYSAVPVSLN